MRCGPGSSSASGPSRVSAGSGSARAGTIPPGSRGPGWCWRWPAWRRWRTAPGSRTRASAACRRPACAPRPRPGPAPAPAPAGSAWSGWASSGCATCSRTAGSGAASGSPPSPGRSRRPDSRSPSTARERELRRIPTPVSPPPGRTGLYHLAVLYPTRAALADALRRLIDADIPLDGASDHGVSEALYLRDPDGNGVELYWDRPRELWPRTGTGTGALAMYSRALDLRGLLAERGTVAASPTIPTPGTPPKDL